MPSMSMKQESLIMEIKESENERVFLLESHKGSRRSRRRRKKGK